MITKTHNVGSTPCCGVIQRNDDNETDLEVILEAERTLSAGVCPDCGSDLTQDPWFVANAGRDAGGGWRWDFNKATTEMVRRNPDLFPLLAKLLTDEQLESLRQYANHAKMRPNEAADKWRDVPTSQEEFDASQNKDYWLEIASTF